MPSFSWLVIFRESFCTWVSQEVSNKHQLYKVLKTKNILLSKTRQKRKTEFSEKTSGLHWIEGQVWRGDRNQGLSGGPRQASQMTHWIPPSLGTTTIISKAYPYLDLCFTIFGFKVQIVGILRIKPRSQTQGTRGLSQLPCGNVGYLLL